MYQKIGVEKLSPTQISKLLNGHRVRVKHGNGMEMCCSPEQHKKITGAGKKGKAHTMQLDPYSMSLNQHLRGNKKGKGGFEDFFTKTLPAAIIKPAKQIGHDLGKPFEVLSPIGNVNPFDLGYQLGYNYIGPAIVGKGPSSRGRGRPKKGSGPFEDFFTKTIPKAFTKKANEYIQNPQNLVADVLDSQSPIKVPLINKNPEALLMRGKGKITRGRRKAVRGRGWFQDLAKAGAKALAPVVIDEASKALKGLVGSGKTTRGRGPVTMSQEGIAKKIEERKAIYNKIRKPIDTNQKQMISRDELARLEGEDTKGKYYTQDMVANPYFKPILNSGGALYQAGYGTKKKAGRPKKGDGMIGDMIGVPLPF